MFSSLLRGSATTVLFRAGLMVVLIASADWVIKANVPLGFLYLFPMLLVGSALPRWQIGAVAAVCTLLTEAFDPFEWFAASGIPRDILYFAAFFCMGLFVYEVGRIRKLAQRHLHQIENEIRARRDAEEQLTVLVESSPAAIFTTGSDGAVLLANDAAHRLFAVPSGTLPGRAIAEFLPSLINVPAHDRSAQTFRTVMQCRGRKQDGEVFLADIWFSTYRTGAGSRLAAMVVDTSEDLRNREESSLHQLLAGSRILVAAVSHEIRNVCGAIAVVHENLARNRRLVGNKDFEALGTLIQALENIAAMELRHTANNVSCVDLYALLEELKIIVDLSLREEGIDVLWSVDEGLPPVWADRQSLMQVFLNLTKNSRRAMASRSTRQLTVTAKPDRGKVVLRFSDTGGGVDNPDRLFQPFQPGARASGLGLYLSRSFMRSFRGDLRHQNEANGSTFLVELCSALSEDQDLVGTHAPGDSDSTVGRPRSIPGEPQPVAPG